MDSLTLVKVPKRFQAMAMFGITSYQIHMESAMQCDSDRGPVVSFIWDVWALFVYVQYIFV